MLPNGSILKVNKAGSISLKSNLVLKETLFVLDFKFNLISVHKLTQISGLKCTFYSSICLLQEPTSDKMVASRRLDRSIYLLNMNKKLAGVNSPHYESAFTG